MALYGIGAYMSNSYMTSYLSGNSSNKNPYKTGNSTSDLYTLMQRADQVRSGKYQKSMLNEYKKVFSGSETGSLESEEMLSDTAKSLNLSAAALSDDSGALYNDREKLTEKVESFIKDYNGTIDAMQKSESVDALKKGLAMTNTTRAYGRTLSRIGIKLGSDNKLTLDKEALGEASAGTLKSLFNSNYSYASKTADKAASISRSASLKAQVTYNSQGNLDYYTRMSLNTMFSEKI